MDLYSKVTKEVDALPDGPQIGAFFDFDGTVIYGYSAIMYLREQVKNGQIKPKQLLDLAKVMTQFGMGNMNFSAMLTMASQFMRGIDEKEQLQFSEELYVKHIAKLIYPESRALIEAHLKKGHTVALVSAATPYQIYPAAKELGIKHIKCSHLEVVDGKFTGDVIRPTCYGMGKVFAAEQLVNEFDLDIDESLFYSDSDEDIQLLEFVGKPRPLNPNKRLRHIARGRGWPVQDFNSRGRTKTSQYVRTFASQLSMLTSFVAGLPIYAVTGSMDKTRNFSMSMFADTAAALTGVELDIEGEEHVWESRPCVFVFNHQSQADVLVLLSLLRRDIAGVGKKELGNIPVMSRLLKFGGLVLIDRENTSSARESMKPLVDTMLKDGRSVCIAPEGTRSTSTNLGRFKKGAFHLAMQAQVPIVPIVIHNAIDVVPRGQYAYNPATVKVTVLPPVPTKDWSVRNLNEHVHDVRDMFLEELDQMRFQPSREERMKAEVLARKLELKKRQERIQEKKNREQAKKTTPVLNKVSQTALNLTSKVVSSDTQKKQNKVKKKTSSNVKKAQKITARSTGSANTDQTAKHGADKLDKSSITNKKATRRRAKKTAPKVSAKSIN